MTAHLSIPALDATPAPVRALAPGENPETDDPAEIARDATVPASMSPAVVDGAARSVAMSRRSASILAETFLESGFLGARAWTIRAR